MAPQQNRPGPGDMTGRQKVQQNKEARQADQDRSAEMSMATAAQTVEEQHGVFDPQSGDRVDAPNAHDVVVVDEPRQSGFPQQNQEPILTGQEDPEAVAPIIAARKVMTVPPVEVVRSSHVVIRVDADIDDMTYGMRNGEPDNYTFKEGMQYKVPLPVAEHLNERGLVRQWISG